MSLEGCLKINNYNIRMREVNGLINKLIVTKLRVL